MPLPNVSQTTPLLGFNAVDRQATQLALTLKKTNSKFAEFMADLSTRLEAVVSPSLAVKSGVYETFGNNFVTRGGMAVMDSVMDATEGIFGKKEDEPEKEKDPISLAIEKQTAMLVDLIGSMKGSVRNDASSDLGEYGGQLTSISESLKKLADKDCCDDSEMVSRLDDLSSKVQKIIDIIGDQRIDDSRRVKKPNTAKLMIESDKKQLTALQNISKILTTHTKFFEKMPQEKITAIEDVFESPKRISAKNYIDVESREIPEKSDVNSPGILKEVSDVLTSVIGLIKKAGTSFVSAISSIIKRVSSFFGSKTGGVSKITQALPRILTGKVGKVATALGLGVGVYQSAKTIPDDIASLPPSMGSESNTIDVDVPRIGYNRVPPETGKTKLPDVDPVTGKPTLDPKKLPDVDPVAGKQKIPDIDPVTGKPTLDPKKLPDIDPVTGKPTLDPKKLPDVDVPKKSGGVLSKIGKGVVKGMRFLPGIGLVVAGADAAYSAFDGVQDSGKIFGTESTSLSQDVSAGIGGVAESLSFGLLDKAEVAKRTQNLYSSLTEKNATQQREIEVLEKKIEDTKASPKSSSGEQAMVVNNVTNNAQTFMSSRKYVENSDASYRRYIDSVFKTC